MKNNLQFELLSDELIVKDEKGNHLGEITFTPTDDPNVVAVPHTGVEREARGQGIAGKLLDHLVEEMAQQGKKIKAVCPYVVEKFERQPDKYDHINADKN